MEDISNVQIYELSKALTSKEAALEILANFHPMLNTANMDENKLTQRPEDLIETFRFHLTNFPANRKLRFAVFRLVNNCF